MSTEEAKDTPVVKETKVADIPTVKKDEEDEDEELKQINGDAVTGEEKVDGDEKETGASGGGGSDDNADKAEVSTKEDDAKSKASKDAEISVDEEKKDPEKKDPESKPEALGGVDGTEDDNAKSASLSTKKTDSTKETSVNDGESGTEEVEEDNAASSSKRKTRDSKKEKSQPNVESETEEAEEDNVTEGDNSKAATSSSKQKRRQSKRRLSQTTGQVSEPDAMEEDSASEGENSQASSSSKKKKKDSKRQKSRTSHESENEEMEDDEGTEGDSSQATSSTKKKKDSKKRKSPTPPPHAREGNRRRERKAVENYDPTYEDHKAKVVKASTPKALPKPPSKTKDKGRGKHLFEFPEIKESMEKAMYDDLMLLYRLFYTSRGRVAKKDLIPAVLNFSGYLPPTDAKHSEEEQADIDNEFEVTMGAKAYKLSIPQLKTICDILGVDRSGVGEMKDGLVDTLLDFLGEPCLMYQKPHQYIEERRNKKAKPTKNSDGGTKKSPKKSHSATKKRQKSRKSSSKAIDPKLADPKSADPKSTDPDDKPLATEDKVYGDIADTPIPDHVQPTDQILRLWVRAFVRCHSMKTSTVRDAIEVASMKFDMDMTESRKRIRELLVEEV